MLMKVWEMKENTIGEMLEDFKLLVVTGVHKNIFKKVQAQVVLTRINQNRINWAPKF